MAGLVPCCLTGYISHREFLESQRSLLLVTLVLIGVHVSPIAFVALDR